MLLASQGEGKRPPRDRSARVLARALVGRLLSYRRDVIVGRLGWTVHQV